ncbi:MAG: hypothetical protein V1799_02840 [bacterium]
MIAGDILFHTDFTFNDKTKGVKLLIILNNPDLSKNEPFLVIRTTSLLKGKQMQPGCIAAWRLFFIPPSEGEFFKEPTLLQLDAIYEMDAITAVRNGIHHTLKQIGQLSALTLAQLKNCLKQIKDDISEKHYKLIFKK